MKKYNSPKFLTISSLIIFAVLTRLLPHPANFTPILAMALFGGAFYEDKRIAFALPFIAMFVSDIFIGFHNTMFFVYFGFLISVFIGFYIRKSIGFRRVLFGALFSSVIFFLVTNLGSWLTDPMYKPLSILSLINCYGLALPFFRNQLAGDLIYSASLFGGFALAGKYLPVLSKSYATNLRKD